MLKKRNKKVFVGLSGGVDSATSAALLQKDGYDVTGVFIKVWQPDWIECTWREDRRDAMRVAAHLGIPFITLDLEKEYKKEVIDYMIAEYAAGRTPNPDVMCNQHVKFGAFYDWAIKEGADAVATGHYARVRDANDTNGRIATNHTNTNQMLAGTDPNKDQSYFLWTLRQEQLGHILFPVGHLLKPEVRRLALEFKLPNADKKDSQGLCFIGKVDVKEFLSHYVKAEKGNVLDISSKIIGTHPGALFFTIGERRGFTITEKTPNDAAYYVTSKNVEKNTITVSDKTEGSLPSAIKNVQISNINWIGETPLTGTQLQARSRYRQPLQKIKIDSLNGSTAMIEFEEGQDTLTPGQSLVIYDGEVCVGGGIIK
ncbi:MAG: tRNA 2-thiouridine(34) synthase MnmA [Patescibacteria group bacterium]